MSKAIITEQLLTDIADELRDKYETSDTYTPAEMADAVSGLTKVSGSIAINVSGTIDVKKYESADVPSGVEGVPTATKGAVSNHSVSVTPSVTNEAGMIVGGTHTGTPVTVSASELVSGSETKTANGTYDVTNLSEVVVDVPTPPSVEVEPLNVTDNGTYTAPSGTAYSPVTVNVSGGSTSGDMSDPIRFFDYDGTLVASYKTVPSELPSVPTHSGLKDGTWNYTLAQLTTQFNAMGTCDIGANYMTQSEDTEIDVVMQEGRLSPILTIAVNGTVTVDWGDNTSADTVTGSSLTTRQAVSHTYASAGSYTIKIHVVSGSFTFYGTTTYLLLRKGENANENRVYANCVQAVRLGAGITSIGGSAFVNCYSLSSISIPSGVTRIGGYAFSACYSLSSISIPSGVTSIENNILQNCYSLSSISIPSGVTSIGGSAFDTCYSLASISIPSGVTRIDGYAFRYCTSLVSINIPDSVTRMESYAFANCYSLASISIPSSVTSMGDSLFSACYSLSSVNIPSGVTSIGASMFSNCYSLPSIVVPSGVTSIGKNMIYYCYGMSELHLMPVTPPTITSSTFSSIPSDCKIYVPAESLEAYKAAQYWSSYASRMIGE